MLDVRAPECTGQASGTQVGGVGHREVPCVPAQIAWQRTSVLSGCLSNWLVGRATSFDPWDAARLRDQHVPSAKLQLSDSLFVQGTGRPIGNLFQQEDTQASLMASNEKGWVLSKKKMKMKKFHLSILDVQKEPHDNFNWQLLARLEQKSYHSGPYTQTTINPGYLYKCHLMSMKE